MILFFLNQSKDGAEAVVTPIQ